MKHAALRRTRTLAAAGALVLVGSLSACGDDGGDAEAAPKDASREEFCDAYVGVFSEVMKLGTDDKPDTDAIEGAVGELADVGTPEGMSDEERQGYEVFVDLMGEVEGGMSDSELEDLGNDLSSEDEKAGEAFTTWAMGECAKEIAGIVPSDMPTELPSDLESELADLESELGGLESEGSGE